MFCSELLDRIPLLFIDNLQIIYFCTGGNFSFSIVKQQHHGRFPPGRVGVPLVTRIPYPTLFHTILFHCAHQENSWRENKPSTQKKYYFFLAALIPALILKKLSKKPKRLRHQKKNHLRHPSVIEKSIKTAQNKDVRKSQRKS